MIDDILLSSAITQDEKESVSGPSELTWSLKKTS